MNSSDNQEAIFSRVEGAAETELRRNHPRYAVELDVSLGSDHNFYAGFVENMSVGGIFVATHALREVGERIEVAIHLPHRAEPVRGTGDVRWIRQYSEHNDVPPGMGVRFIELEGDAEQAIREFLAQRDPLFHEE